MTASSLLRIAVVQFAPKLGDVQANLARARALCRGLTPRSVDVVCFPEMVFSGYMFPDAPSIAPYLEHPTTGPTARFCAELARDLQCYVAAGYPERLDPSEGSASGAHANPDPDPSSLAGANAALLYDPTGRRVHTYHKSNLFRTDRTWARPGPGFAARDLAPPLGRTALAVCNDLNVRAPDAWASVERGPYELAAFCARAGVRTVVLLNAWLRPEPSPTEPGAVSAAGGGGDVDGAERAGARAATVADDEDGEEAGDGDEDALEPNWSVLNYWAMRLRPLWAGEEADGRQACIVVVCNRSGRERGSTFAGSSAVFAMVPGSGRPRLLQAMGEREEGVRVWTVRTEPHMLV